MSNLFTHIHCKMGLMSHNFPIWMNVVPLCKCSEAVAWRCSVKAVLKNTCTGVSFSVTLLKWDFRTGVFLWYF